MLCGIHHISIKVLKYKKRAFHIFSTYFRPLQVLWLNSEILKYVNWCGVNEYFWPKTMYLEYNAHWDELCCWLVFKKYVVSLNLIPVNKLWERKLRHWLTLINMTKSCQGKLSLQPISGVILSCTIIYQALIKPFSFFCILISSPRFIMINYELKINCILK